MNKPGVQLVTTETFAVWPRLVLEAKVIGIEGGV